MLSEDVARRDTSFEPDLSVVVMTYNEAETIGAVLDQISATLEALRRPSEIIVVDDGSSDASGAVAEQWTRARAWARTVRHSVNRGLGGVYATGFREASGRFVTFMPADGQFPADNLEVLRAAADEHDLVLGYLSGGQRRPVARILSGAEKLVYRLMVGRMPRFQGLFMVRRSVLVQYPLLSEGRGWGIVLEMVLRIVRAGHTCTSVLTRAQPRRAGRSKVKNLPTILANLRQVLALRALLKRGTGKPRAAS